MKLDLSLNKIDKDFKYESITFILNFEHADLNEPIRLKKYKFKPTSARYNIRYGFSQKDIYFKGGIVKFYLSGKKKTIYEFSCDILVKNDSTMCIEFEDDNVTLILDTRGHHYKIHPCDVDNKRKILCMYV